MSIKAIGQLTIVDLTDPIVSDVEPENKFKDMIWMDTSQTPPVMKIWNGSRWEIVGSDEDEITNLKKRMGIMEQEIIQINKHIGRVTSLLEDISRKLGE